MRNLLFSKKIAMGNQKSLLFCVLRKENFIEFDKISPTRECIILNSGSEMCTELADRKIVTKIGVIVPKDVQSYFITYSVCSFENHCVKNCDKTLS